MEYAPEYYKKETLILGVGNILFGDDGFGPAVADYLNEHYRASANTAILDVGTSVRQILFNLIVAEKKPKRVVIVDALQCGRTPGEVFKVSIEEIPEKKVNDFSLHMVPTLNMLKELRDLCNVEVVVLAAQPENIPDLVSGDMTETMKKAVIEAGDYIAEQYLADC
jgi:coenzyme F420 hydrogenase subunit delta